MTIRSDGVSRSGMVPFVDPSDHTQLVVREDGLVHAASDALVAPIIGGIPRFVPEADNYAASFGWQWNHWESELSDARRTGSAKRTLLLERTGFDPAEFEGRTLLECGMGGGDDTEVFLTFPFSAVHAFDLSTAVERAARFLHDERLVLSQASIFDIPYPDEAFDFVFCHRVLQHTPDPAAALRAVCKKLKPGGLLFAHSYKRSWRYMMGYKYKYRWLTKRLPPELVHRYVDRMGPALHELHQRASRSNRVVRFLAYAFVPFEPMMGYGDSPAEDVLEIAKLCTFDALTPQHDHPMSTRDFCRIIEDEGLEIVRLHDPKSSPLYCTARRPSADGVVEAASSGDPDDDH